MRIIYLSEREYSGICAASFGLRNKEIANRFGVNPRTVEHWMSGAYIELGISCRRELPVIFSQDYFFKIKLYRKIIKIHKPKWTDTFKFKFAINFYRFSIIYYALLKTSFKLLNIFLLCYEFF